MPGPPPRGDRAATPAERSAAGGTTCPATARGATAEALDVVLELRGLFEDLQAVELQKGFGRD
jgi:hypothetical protein